MPLVENNVNGMESESPGESAESFDPSDPRWLLVQRILATPDFERSPRLSDFLRYICRLTLEGRSDAISEQHIGEVVFGRGTISFDGYLKDEEATAAVIEDALRETPHALVDVSHRQFALEVSGPYAEIILRGACPLDLHISQFPVGMCTRTVLAKADITLWRTREDAFHMEVWRSFAGYVGGLLTENARELYPGV